MAAPTGRARKPTKYVPNASRTPVTGSVSGKNNFPKTSPAAVLDSRKSYHSMVVRTVLDTNARRRIRRRAVSSTSVADGVAWVMLYGCIQLIVDTAQLQ